MERIFCKDKKGFCDCIEDCRTCEFAKGNGVINGNVAHDVLETLFGLDYDLDRLRELVKADRDGRCVVLPCKPHDHMFEISCGKVREIIVCGFSIRNKREVVDYVRMSGGYVECAAIEMRIDDFAREMYKTREAAEDALKGEQK